MTAQFLTDYVLEGIAICLNYSKNEQKSSVCLTFTLSEPPVRPLTVLTGILLGSAFAISLGLAVVALLFFLLLDEYPRLETEVQPLLRSTALFVLLTALSAAGFVGVLKNTAWRWYAQAAMWLSLLGIGWYYWP